MNTSSSSEKSLVETIEFFVDEPILTFVKQSFASFKANCSLRDSCVIDATFTDNLHYQLQALFGFNIAMEKLLENPERKIFIFSALTTNVILRLAEDRNFNAPLVLTTPSVRYLTHKELKVDYHDIFEKSSNVSMADNLLHKAAIGRYPGIIKKMAARIPPIDKEYLKLEHVDKEAVEEMRKYFPHLHDKSNFEVHTFLLSLKQVLSEQKE